MENIRKMRDDSIDPSYTSTAQVHAPRSNRTSLGPGPSSLQCFTEGSGFDARSNASGLKENAIRLGDVDDYDQAVNGPCFNDVCQNYLDMALGDEGKGQEEVSLRVQSINQWPRQALHRAVYFTAHSNTTFYDITTRLSEA